MDGMFFCIYVSLYSGQQSNKPRIYVLFLLFWSLKYNLGSKPFDLYNVSRESAIFAQFSRLEGALAALSTSLCMCVCFCV